MRVLSVVFLALALEGCALFEPGYVELSPEQVAQITATAGELNTETLDAWIAEAERMLGVKVTAIVETAQGKIAELAPIVEEAGEEAGTTLLDQIAENPTPAGIIAGAAAAIFAVLRVLSRRKRLEVTK